jgi:hypothetical protein
VSRELISTAILLCSQHMLQYYSGSWVLFSLSLKATRDCCKSLGSVRLARALSPKLAIFACFGHVGLRSHLTANSPSSLPQGLKASCLTPFPPLQLHTLTLANPHAASSASSSSSLNIPAALSDVWLVRLVFVNFPILFMPLMAAHGLLYLCRGSLLTPTSFSL